MTNIFDRALEHLRDEHEDPVVRDACAGLLSIALEGGLEARLPGEVPIALFRWLIGPGAGRSWLLATSLGRVRSETITKEAVETLLGGKGSKEVRDACSEILTGVNAGSLDDRTISELLTRCREEADRLIRLVEAAHAGRGIARAVLLAMRDSLQKSDHVDARVASASVAMLLEFDIEFFRILLHDQHELVRAEAVRVLGKRGTPGPSVRLISEKVVNEPVVWLKGEMLQALGKLVQRMPE